MFKILQVAERVDWTDIITALLPNPPDWSLQRCKLQNVSLIKIVYVWPLKKELFAAICHYQMSRKALCPTHAAVFGVSGQIYSPPVRPASAACPGPWASWRPSEGSAGSARAWWTPAASWETSPEGSCDERQKARTPPRWNLAVSSSEETIHESSHPVKSIFYTRWTRGELWAEKSAGLPPWCERWFCNCTERRWILLSPPDGNWWPLDRGGRPCRRNSGVLWWQYGHINTNMVLKVDCMKTIRMERIFCFIKKPDHPHINIVF